MRISDWSSDVCSSDLLAETQARNGRLDIRAPAAGLVLTRDVEPGQIVSAGSGVLFRVALGGQMEMQAKLAESDLARLRAGPPPDIAPARGVDADFRARAERADVPDRARVVVGAVAPDRQCGDRAGDRRGAGIGRLALAGGAAAGARARGRRGDGKSTRLNSSHQGATRMPAPA